MAIALLDNCLGFKEGVQVVLVYKYGHLEYQSKKKTAKIIKKSLPLKKVEAVNL